MRGRNQFFRDKMSVQPSWHALHGDPREVALGLSLGASPSAFACLPSSGYGPPALCWTWASLCGSHVILRHPAKKQGTASCPKESPDHHFKTSFLGQGSITGDTKSPLRTKVSLRLGSLHFFLSTYDMHVFPRKMVLTHSYFPILCLHFLNSMA